jgi:hypothetical protein
MTGFLALQFRASVNFADPRNPGGVPQDLSVILTDRMDHSASVRVSDLSESLFYPPGTLSTFPSS